jgi:hypothetical protein
VHHGRPEPASPAFPARAPRNATKLTAPTPNPLPARIIFAAADQLPPDVAGVTGVADFGRAVILDPTRGAATEDLWHLR